MLTPARAPLSQRPRWRLDALAGSGGMRGQLKGLRRRSRDLERTGRLLGQMSVQELAEALDSLGRLEADWAQVTATLELTQMSGRRDFKLPLLLFIYGPQIAAGRQSFLAALESLPKLNALAARPELSRQRHFLKGLAAVSSLDGKTQQELDKLEKESRRWAARRDQQVAGLVVRFDGGDGERDYTIQSLLAFGTHADRELRRRAISAGYQSLSNVANACARSLDEVIAARLRGDELSGQGLFTSALLGSDLPAAAFHGPIEAVRGRMSLPRRWLEAKVKAFGIERPAIYDFTRPLGDTRPISLEQALAAILETAGELDPALPRLATRLVNEGHLDLEERHARHAIEVCLPVNARVLPYLRASYHDRLSDALSLGHETAHALGFASALAHQWHPSALPGPALSEVPAAFFELVLLERLLGQGGPLQAGALLRRSDFLVSWVFRPLVQLEFELEAYELRAQGAILTADRLGAAWVEKNRAYYGDTVDFVDGYEHAWTIIPQFLHARFYGQSYLFARLLALLLLDAHRQRDISAPFRALLEAGGSAAPAELLQHFGFDLSDHALWSSALDLLENQVASALPLLETTPNPRK